MKLWAGRFEKNTDRLVDKLNASIAYDQRMYREDITGSMAHAAMLGAQGIIPRSEADLIVKALGEILEDCEAGKVQFSEEHEDIHMNIEVLLTQRIGDAGKRLHTARSRNDQVAVDLKMYLRREIDALQEKVRALIAAICRKASDHLESIMPGYTHLQRAQPSTFAHYTMAYAEMLRRDAGRLADCRARLNLCPLGSGAMGGTTYPIDRARTAAALGFDGPTENSIDGVSDRDYVLEMASALSILMMHLSRFSEEIILWASYEFGFVSLDDAYATGSSIMPQKKNPDFAELIRGKSGRVIGDLMALMVTVKSLPLAYNKDLQEDKEGAIDAANTLEDCYRCAAGMIATMQVNPDAMTAQARKGYLAATDVADYLAKKGLPFRRAHEVVGHLVLLCEKRGCDLEDLTLDDFKAECDLFEADIAGALNLPAIVAARTTYGGTGHEAVRAQLAEARERLAADEAAIA